MALFSRNYDYYSCLGSSKMSFSTGTVSISVFKYVLSSVVDKFFYTFDLFFSGGVSV